MRLLLDTQVLLWAAAAPDRLGHARSLIVRSDRVISAASAWELAIKQGIGKLRLGEPVGSWVARATRELAATALPVTAAHAALVETLPPIHRDPFDRLLVAQALAENLTLLTADAALLAYGPSVRSVH